MMKCIWIDVYKRQVMVFAKTKQAAAKLSVQVSSRSMEKEYLAVTEGIPQPSEGELCDWLLRNGRTNTSHLPPAGPDGGSDRYKAPLSFSYTHLNQSVILRTIHAADSIEQICT